MFREPLSLDLARQVAPRALQAYAAGLGWEPVANGKRPEIAIFQRPGSPLHQILVPTDEGLKDYDEMVAEAVGRLAEYEKRPAAIVLAHLLLPPADVLRFREVSPDAETGSLPFEHAVQMLNGARKLLLSAAHSVLVPQPYHTRLSRSEAEAFVNRCRLAQTERGSFVLTVSCPLEQQVMLPGLTPDPFARRVTTLLMDSLAALAYVGHMPQLEEFFSIATTTPGLSANLCESLLMMRPHGDRASLSVSASWSRALLPSARSPSQEVQLRQEVFDIVEVLAARLRTIPEPRRSRFYGFVEALHGHPTPNDPRPSGEVRFILFDQDEEILARADLNADDHALAGQAYLAGDLVTFKGILHRLPRLNQIEEVRAFERVRLDGDGLPESTQGAGSQVSRS